MLASSCPLGQTDARVFRHLDETLGDHADFTRTARQARQIAEGGEGNSGVDARVRPARRQRCEIGANLAE